MGVPSFLKILEAFKRNLKVENPFPYLKEGIDTL
jgi:hypothetical protein